MPITEDGYVEDGPTMEDYLALYEARVKRDPDYDPDDPHYGFLADEN